MAALRVRRAEELPVESWLQRARESLFHMTRAHLSAELGVSGAELESLVRLVRSQLDVSVCRILREAE